MSDRLIGGLGYTVDWDGDVIMAAAIDATRMGINDITRRAAMRARAEHPWENDTGQTEESVFSQAAEVEGPPLRVWGEWGVRDIPREEEQTLNPSEAYMQLFDEAYGPGGRELAKSKVLTTKDVALFLEFGTVKMEPRPWLYPVWDSTKLGLADAIAIRYRSIVAGGGSHILRNSLGQAMTHSSAQDTFGILGDTDA